jgi:hypothetical protein
MGRLFSPNHAGEKTGLKRAQSRLRLRRRPPTVSLKSLLLTATVASVCIAVPRTGRASDFYARLLAGPAYFHNDNVSETYDTSGFGLVSQVDVGARLGRPVALHASFVYDTSRWMGFDSDLFVSNGGYETTVLGLGLGATGTWDRLSLGAVLGAQFTTHPGGNDAGEGPDHAGLGPLFSVTAGYLLPTAVDGIELGAHALARYRFGKDEYDPSGYQLGVGFSVAVQSDGSKADDTRGDERELEPQPEPTVGYASAQIGWWNAELEFLTKPGIYVAAGAPWVMALLGAVDDRTYVPFGGRVGYQFDVSKEWKVRAAAHLVGWKEIDQECFMRCSPYTETWQLLEVGARHQSASGLIYGIDVPLLAIENVLGLDDRDREDAHVFVPPLSIVLTQVYVGYSWAI